MTMINIVFYIPSLSSHCQAKIMLEQYILKRKNNRSAYLYTHL